MMIEPSAAYPPSDVALAFVMRGLAHDFLDDTKNADADFDRAIAELDLMIGRNSLDSEALWTRGIAHRGRNNYTQAFADFDEAIRLDPQKSGIFNSRCWARALLGTELDIARTDCDTAARLSNGRSADALDSRGMISLKQGRFADAWADYDAAARLMPNDASHRYGRGIAALRLGRSEEGKADLSDALRLSPHIPRMFEDYGMTP